jgi:Tfp pilus assembly protein PilX
MRERIQSLRDDERGFAIILAVALMALVTTASLVIFTLTQSENSNSRRDQTQSGAYQAAEAGTNAYLADLTQDIGFYNSEVAKGEATRTGGTDGLAHANNCTVTCSDMTWNTTWGTTWTYVTSRASDTGWYTVPAPGGATSQEYQYLIQVYPPNKNLVQNEAQLITRIDVTGRPYGSTNTSTWRTIETLLRPSSLADFQAFLAQSETYGPTAVTTGPIFVGEDNSGVAGNLVHQGTAKANLYAEGTVSGGTTYQNGAVHYDKNTTPNALCKLNNCSPVPFTTFTNYIATVKSAADSTGGIDLPTTDPGNTNLASQTPAYAVDAWKLTFNSNGTVTVLACKKVNSTTADYTSTTPPTCYVAKNAPYGNGTTSTPISTLTPVKFPIYSATDVILSGTVHGTVTVASGDDIIYGGNTTYVADGTDVLGLEATNDIVIPAWAIYAAAGGNITIYSAQFSLNGSFEADPTSTTGCSWTNGTNPAGYSTCDSSHTSCTSTTICTMNIYGSSALYGNSNGPILMTNAFGHRNYNYDNNLLFLPPPYFPTLPNAFTILVQREI